MPSISAATSDQLGCCRTRRADVLDQNEFDRLLPRGPRSLGCRVPHPQKELPSRNAIAPQHLSDLLAFMRRTVETDRSLSSGSEHES
jgi:hypothetical protein